MKNFGGLYIDTDIVMASSPVKLNSLLDFYIGMEQDNWIGVGPGLLEELVIHWPGGEVTEVGDVPADHTVTVGVDGSVAVQPPGPGSGK